MSVYIIAEAGSNWRMGSPARDRAMARTLIEVAAEAGADAVKFQTFRPETIYAPNAGQCDHLIEKGVVVTMEELFGELAMPYEMIPELAEHCRHCGVDFLSSCFSPADFAQVDPYVPAHKIASAELHHLRLLELAARSGKPLYLSTGACTEEEIAWALETFKQAGGKQVTLLHCTMQYPAQPTGMHVRALTWLARRFGLPVGLSDHSVAPVTAPVMAVALGASVIEKHYTVDNRLIGPDHSWTLTPRTLKEMVDNVRLAEQMVGEEEKRIFDEEMGLADHYRRGVQALKPVRAGEELREGVNMAILRPGNCPTGIHPRRIGELEGAKAACDIGAGVGIQEGDWQ